MSDLKVFFVLAVVCIVILVILGFGIRNAPVGGYELAWIEAEVATGNLSKEDVAPVVSDNYISVIEYETLRNISRHNRISRLAK